MSIMVLSLTLPFPTGLTLECKCDCYSNLPRCFNTFTRIGYISKACAINDNNEFEVDLN